MGEESRFLAFDFGAESGRALLGRLADGRLRLDEIHRFPNGPVRTLGGLHWDVLRLFADIKHGLKQALVETDGRIDGIGIDTWGVDFALIGSDGEILGNPFHYRDERTNGMLDEACRLAGREHIYDKTGIQFLPFNTLYQMLAMVKTGSPALKSASGMLLMADLFNYWLTGKQVCEFSNATTTQFYNPRQGTWAKDLLLELDIPTHILPQIVQPGTVIGPLDERLVAELGSGSGVPVIAPATHDTGSAVAAVPAEGDSHAYISSGTWSLMGVEIREPLINEQSLAMSFTNEGGVAGTFRFLRNIMGLWLVQECRRTWLAAGEDVSYADLAAMAEECEGFVSIVDPDATVFLTPGDMPKRIQDFCRETRQPVPETKGQIVRCALDSLALRYRATVESLDKLFGKRHDPIHIVGGGTQNKLLCQLAADAMGRTVVAGPVEATAIGNVLVQAMGAGVVGTLAEARQIVRDSSNLLQYQPRQNPAIEAAYRLFQDIAQ